MKYPLKWRLSLSYSMVALVLVCMISFFSNHLLDRYFRQYIIRQQAVRNEEVVRQVAQQYDADTGRFRAQLLEIIGMGALENGMILRVSAADGTVLWDALEHNNGLCHQMLQNMAHSMKNRYPTLEGAYEEKVYPVIAGSVQVGQVDIGYYGPFYLSSSDAAFIDALNRALVAIGIVSLVLAAFLGLYMARRISQPVEQAIAITEKIADGDYTVMSTVRSGTLELARLTASVNRLSSALAQQEALRKRLTADIAHELRTPLSTLQGNIEALLDGVWEADAERLSSLHEEILRLARLVADMERLSRLESESIQLNLSVFDIGELAEKAAQSFALQCREQGVSIAVTGGPVQLCADADKLRQVLVNLFSNSLRYMPDGGQIAVRLTQEKEFVRIEVEDSGRGIAQEHLPYIFERFYRVDDSRSSRSGGAGVGLAIVRAIIWAHAGTITAESRIGEGTCFTIRLPLPA